MQFYAACVLHEMGHILAACLVGVRIKSVVFSGGGIRMLTDRASVVTNCENVLMLLSGPAVNLFLAAALSIHGAVGDFAMLNLAAGLYNLLPFRQLDGGALVDIFITGTVHEREWRGVLLAVRIIIVLAGAAVFCCGRSNLTINIKFLSLKSTSAEQGTWLVLVQIYNIYRLSLNFS